MNEFFSRIVAQVRELWSRLSRPQRIWAGGLGAALFLLFLGLILFANRIQWVSLGNFELQQAAEIKAELERKGFVLGSDYQLTNEGKTIEVNAKRRNEASLALAEKGLFGKSEKGFQIFDEFNITSTEFEQRRREVEALKSEMRRLIRSYSQVDDISITVPYVENDNPFQDDKMTRTASVVLTLKSGAKLDNEQIRAIRSIIAGGFPGLDEANVNLTDNYMRPLLADDDGGMPGGAITTKQGEVVHVTERALEDKIRTVLGPVLGNDKFTVAAQVEFEFDAVKILGEEYSKSDFDQLLQGQQKTSETLKGQGLRPGGEPGVNANVPPVYNSVSGIGPVDYSRSEEIINYLANKTITERIQSPFLKRMSASVAVDGSWKEITDTAGTLSRAYTARAPEEMDKIKALVSAALGLRPERGDVVEVLNVPWSRDREFKEADAVRAAGEFQKKLLTYTLFSIPLLLGFIMLLMMWRKSVRLREEEMARTRELDRQRALASAEAGLAGEISLEDQERQEIQRRASSLARAKPQIVADLVRTWLAEEPPPAAT